MNIQWQVNKRRIFLRETEPIPFLEKSVIEKIAQFHKSYERYNPTPVIQLNELSMHLGVKNIFVKDESQRLELHSFKVLGGFYAIGQFISQKLGVPIEELSFDQLTSVEVKKQLGEITFASATDGNHGRGVAWAAQQLGHKAVIYMPKGSSSHRLQHIKDTGAKGYITEWNYDDTVRFVAEKAKEENWVVVQDTAWEGYEEIPEWIMQGYALIAYEAVQQLAELKEKPTHVFLQAGVGSFAGAVLGALKSYYEAELPATYIVEPNQADCYYRSFEAGNGEPVNVSGSLSTIMAGLACGEPNQQAWNIIVQNAEGAFSCEDEVAAIGMRVLGNPLGSDKRVISGESGAVTAGLIYQLLSDEQFHPIRSQIGLDEQANILVINTEGDTDPVHYRKIVWGATS